MSMKSIVTQTVATSIVLLLIGNNVAQAVDGGPEDAMEVRRLLNARPLDFHDVPLAKTKSAAGGETIVLPVSQGFHQRGTGLCWAYATLNALETIYLVRNPGGLDVELSRRAMQYYTMEDRYRRSIKKVNTYITEAGVAMDAIRLIQCNGIVSFDDYPDIADSYGQANIRDMINSAESVTDKLVAMYEGLDVVYTTPPTLTHIPGSPTVQEPDPIYVEAEAGVLAQLVLAGDVWQSYAPSETKVGFDDHPDPDARWENLSWYMPPSEFPGRIKQALEAGFPVMVTVRNHVVLLYGAEYDSDGAPVTYYIKDSYDELRFIDGHVYWGYFYEAEANYLHEIFWEMTTVKL